MHSARTSTGSPPRPAGASASTPTRRRARARTRRPGSRRAPRSDAVERSSTARSTGPSAPCGRRATTRRATRRWASACSTTSPSARPRRSPAGSSAWRSSTSTCTTATARRTSSGRDPRVLLVSSHQYPVLPGDGRPGRGGAGERAGLHGEPADAGRAAATPSTRPCTARSSSRSAARFDPQLVARLGRLRRGRRRPARRHEREPGGIRALADVCVAAASGAGQGARGRRPRGRLRRGRPGLGRPGPRRASARDGSAIGRRREDVSGGRRSGGVVSPGSPTALAGAAGLTRRRAARLPRPGARRPAC